MRLALWILAIALIGAVLNAAGVRSIAPSALAPDFALILTVVIAFYHSTPLGLLGAFSLGILADFSSTLVIGPNAAGCVVAFCTVGLIANRMYAEKWVAVMIITLVCSIAKSVTYLGLMSIYFPGRSGDEVIHRLLGEAIVTAMFSPVVIAVLRRQAFRPAAFGKSAKSSLGAVSTGSGRWSPGTRLNWI